MGVDGGQAKASDGTYLWGRGVGGKERGRGPVSPGDSLFVKNSFLMRSVSSELCLLTLILSWLQVRCLISLPLDNPQKMKAAILSPPSTLPYVLVF